MPLKNWSSIYARCSKSSLKHSIRFSGIFPSLKQNLIAYRSSKVSSRPDCIFEIHQRWQSGFNRVYSNSCCSCSFEPEIIKIGQSSQKMYSINILNYKGSISILNSHTKKVWKRIEGPTYIYSLLSMFRWTGPFRGWFILCFHYKQTLEYTRPKSKQKQKKKFNLVQPALQQMRNIKHQ